MTTEVAIAYSLGPAPVPAADALEEPGVAEVFQPTVLAVALACGVDQGQVARRTQASLGLGGR